MEDLCVVFPCSNRSEAVFNCFHHVVKIRPGGLANFGKPGLNGCHAVMNTRALEKAADLQGYRAAHHGANQSIVPCRRGNRAFPAFRCSGIVHACVKLVADLAGESSRDGVAPFGSPIAVNLNVRLMCVSAFSVMDFPVATSAYGNEVEEHFLSNPFIGKMVNLGGPLKAASLA